MKHNFVQSLTMVLAHEGGWSDHPSDGETKMRGISLRMFQRYYGSDKNKNDLHNIDDIKINRIYREAYWDQCLCDDLPNGIDYVVFDTAIHSGPQKAIEWLQKAAKITQNGIITKETINMIVDMDIEILINRMIYERLTAIMRLPGWAMLKHKWMKRIQSVRRDALEMISRMTVD